MLGHPKKDKDNLAMVVRDHSEDADLGAEAKLPKAIHEL